MRFEILDYEKNVDQTTPYLCNIRIVPISSDILFKLSKYKEQQEKFKKEYV